jgi:hypothetical protein
MWTDQGSEISCAVGGADLPRRACIAALHKKCFPDDKNSGNLRAVDASAITSQLRRISCSPLEVFTFTPAGRVIRGPFFVPHAQER